ncbi:oxidoreductase [Gryllotalpicola koreensis]|uniref:Aldo/keto reductase family oxidoreductase n=1 Tax=Gryllotalpicola koreensis TaxID=993086 RepID=A0ABP8A974_9MICO
MPTPTSLPGGSWMLGDRLVPRFGFGAMQLSGPGVMGPPRDYDEALAVLRSAVEAGIAHIDTSVAYGPRTVNEVIRDALHPYPDSLLIATKVGAERDERGGWPTARTPADLRAQVRETAETLGVDTLDLVNMRMGDANGPQPGSIAEAFETLAELQQAGLIRHLGVSNVTAAQVEEARTIAPIVCVQNAYNLAHRVDDDLIDQLAVNGIAYVPFFPLGGGYTPYVSAGVPAVAARHGATEKSVALAWLLHRSPNILVISGTSSAQHLRENIVGAGLELTDEDVAELNGRAA